MAFWRLNTRDYRDHGTCFTQENTGGIQCACVFRRMTCWPTWQLVVFRKKNNVYKMYLALYILTLIVTLTEGFYLPGLAPVVYCEKSANNDKCQVKMPFYTVQLPFWLLFQPFRLSRCTQFTNTLRPFSIYFVLSIISIT